MHYDDMSFEEKFNYLVMAYPHAKASWLSERLYGSLEAVDGLAPQPAAGPEDYEAWAYWILDSPKLMAMIEDKSMQYFKINLIKEVRAASNMGLAESKKAVERAVWLHDSGVIGKHEAERLARDVEQIVKSLTGGE